ncbi:MAG: hypothetical protein ACREEE_11015 [Dongiaceae bacterium]
MIRFVASVLFCAMLLAAPAAWTGDYILDISGSPALLVKIKCTVVTADSETKSLKFQAYVPAKYLLQYSAASCYVQKWDQWGRLRVTLRQDRTAIAWAETAAAYNYVTVRSEGPWGRAAGVRGAIAFPLSNTTGRTLNPPLSVQPGLAPPLNPPLVPPLNIDALP